MNPKTRQTRDGVLAKLDDKAGKLNAEALPPARIKKWRDAPEGPDSGNIIVKTLRQVLDVAKEDGLITHNVAAEVPYRKGSREGYRAWTINDVHQYIKAHPPGTMAYKALCLFLFTGQRRSDVYQLGPQHVHDGRLVIDQKKNKERKDRETMRIEIPVVAPLAEVLNDPPSHQLAFLTSERGMPFANADSFGNWFRKRVEVASLKGRSQTAFARNSAISWRPSPDQSPDPVDPGSYDAEGGRALHTPRPAQAPR